MYSFKDLKVGSSFIEKRKISEKIIKSFAYASRDRNPIHLDEKFAKKTIFKGRIAHGILVASFISSLIGNKFPGPGTIYVSQNLIFKKPVRINDIVTVKVSVKKKIKRKGWCELLTTCLVKNKIVLEGIAVVVPPKKNYINISR